MYMQTHAYVHAYTHTYVHVCMYACMHACTHTHTQVVKRRVLLQRNLDADKAEIRRIMNGGATKGADGSLPQKQKKEDEDEEE